jgi:predicted MarR family transcription regulator
MTYDLRRLRLHGLIQRIPGTRRYQVTPTGLHQAMFLTRIHDRLLRDGMAHLTDPDPPAPKALRAAANAWDKAIDQLSQHASIAA